MHWLFLDESNLTCDKVLAGCGTDSQFKNSKIFCGRFVWGNFFWGPEEVFLRPGVFFIFSSDTLPWDLKLDFLLVSGDSISMFIAVLDFGESPACFKFIIRHWLVCVLLPLMTIQHSHRGLAVKGLWHIKLYCDLWSCFDDSDLFKEFFIYG